VSKTYQKAGRRAEPDPPDPEITVPEQVVVSMTEIAESAREGLLALAVGTGLQVMTAMFEEDVTRLCGPDGKHNADRAGYRHGARGRLGHPGRPAHPGDPSAGAGRLRHRRAAPAVL